MNDNSTGIPVLIESAEVQGDKELKINGRFVIGYLKAIYESDADISVTIYFKRDDGMLWESIDPVVLSKSEKRYFGKLPLIGTVIDLKIILSCTTDGLFNLTLLTVSVKQIETGKYS